MPPLLLSIETAGDVCGVALGRAGEIVAEEALHGPRLHAAGLAPMIVEILRGAGARAADLDAIAVSAGPGSYTGLRIGVSTAKGLCAATGARLVAVPTLAALGRGAAGLVGAGERVVAALPSRRGEVYAAEVSPGDDLATPAARALALSDLPADLAGAGDVLVVGPAAEDLAAALRRVRAGVRAAPTSLAARPVLVIGMARLAAGIVADAATFEPDYVTPAYVG